MRHALITAIAFTTLIAATQPASTQVVAQKADWRTSLNHPNADGCTAYTDGRHGQAQLMVWYDPDPDYTSSLSWRAFSVDSKIGDFTAQPTLTIGNTKFRLGYIQNEYYAVAWDLEQQQKIIRALRRQRVATLTGNTKRGPINEKFSLMGATAMTNDAARRCRYASALHPYPSQTRTVATQQHQPDPNCEIGVLVDTVEQSYGIAQAIDNESIDVGGAVFGIFQNALSQPDC